MEKGSKIFLIIFAILLITILVDTIQARVFDNRPLIKMRYNLDGGNVDFVDKGIFVYTYVFTNGEKVTVFRWEKYAPPQEVIVDSQKNNTSEVDNIMEDTRNINVNINGKKYNLVIEDNETAKEFISLLPQEFNMKELNGNEKYVYMENSLPTNSINPEHIEGGDVMLYGSDCLVIFYKSFDTNYSYTKIGHIDNLPDLGNDNVIVKFEK